MCSQGERTARRQITLPVFISVCRDVCFTCEYLYELRPLLDVRGITDDNKDYILQKESCEFIGWSGNLWLSLATLLQNEAEVRKVDRVRLKCPWLSGRLCSLKVRVDDISPMCPDLDQSSDQWYNIISSPGKLAIAVSPYCSKLDIVDRSFRNHPTSIANVLRLPHSMTGSARAMEMEVPVDITQYWAKQRALEDPLFHIYIVIENDTNFETAPPPIEALQLLLTFEVEIELGGLSPFTEFQSVVYTMDRSPEEQNLRAVSYSSNHIICATQSFGFSLTCNKGLNFVSGYAINARYDPPGLKSQSEETDEDDFVIL